MDKKDYPLARDKRVSRNKVMRKRQICAIHYHEEYELYYMLDGKTTYFIGDEIFCIEKGNFVCIPPEILHMTDSRECMRNERILLHFREELFDEKTASLLEALSSLRVIYIPDHYLPILEELLFKIEAEFNQNEKGKEILLDLYILELLTLLCRYRCAQKANIKESDTIIYRISEYIRDNFERDITLQSLSKTFAVSQGYLSRKFKAVTGMGLNQYITYERIANGERLLRETGRSVTEVAELCGYNDSNYFATVFKKMKGVTPLKYRKQQELRR